LRALLAGLIGIGLAWMAPAAPALAAAPACTPVSELSGQVRLSGMLAREGSDLVLALSLPICLPNGRSALRVRLRPVGYTMRARLNGFSGQAVVVRGDDLEQAGEADPPLALRALGVVKAP